MSSYSSILYRNPIFHDCLLLAAAARLLQESWMDFLAPSSREGGQWAYAPTFRELGGHYQTLNVFFRQV